MFFDFLLRKVLKVIYYYIYFKIRGIIKWKKFYFLEFGKSIDLGKVRKGSEGFYYELGVYYEYNFCNIVKYNCC